MRRVHVTCCARSNGLVLVTGPTGCGKTTTLYAALGEVRKQNVNMITVEDPVEYHIDGIEQIQVNPAAGYTFAQGPAPYPAPRPGRDHDRRDPRPGDRQDRHRERAHRPPGAVHAAYQRRRQRGDAADGDGRGAVSC